ncbi:hypothetical protein JOM56_011635 [Amanita muscaria]
MLSANRVDLSAKDRNEVQVLSLRSQSSFIFPGGTNFPQGGGLASSFPPNTHASFTSAVTPATAMPQSFGYSMSATPPGSAFSPAAQNNQWWIPTSTPFQNLSPMSKFMVQTQPINLNPYDDSHNWNVQSFMPDGIFSNTTNLTSDAFMSPVPSVVYPLSYSQLHLNEDAIMPSSDSNCVSFTPQGAEKASMQGSENTELSDHEGEAPTAQSKPHRRSRKDEVDTAFVLPEGVMRAHKPRCLGDDSHWQGAAPKKRRRK